MQVEDLHGQAWFGLIKMTTNIATGTIFIDRIMKKSRKYGSLYTKISTENIHRLPYNELHTGHIAHAPGSKTICNARILMVKKMTNQAMIKSEWPISKRNTWIMNTKLFSSCRLPCLILEIRASSHPIECWFPNFVRQVFT